MTLLLNSATVEAVHAAEFAMIGCLQMLKATQKSSKMALQGLERADLDEERNVIAPFVREDSPDTRNGMEVDDSDAGVIDVDSLDLE